MSNGMSNTTSIVVAVVVTAIISFILGIEVGRRPVEIPLATYNLLENTDGVLRTPPPSPPPIIVRSGRHSATFYLC